MSLSLSKLFFYIQKLVGIFPLKSDLQIFKFLNFVLFWKYLYFLRNISFIFCVYWRAVPYVQCCSDKQGCESGPFWPEPDPEIFTESGSYRYFGNVKLYKQGKNILKIELLHIFRWIFPFFQKKIIIIQISEEIWLKWKKCICLNWFLVFASRIRIRFLKFWFAGSGSGQKWTGSATLCKATPYTISC